MTLALKLRTRFGGVVPAGPFTERRRVPGRLSPFEANLSAGSSHPTVRRSFDLELRTRSRGEDYFVRRLWRQAFGPVSKVKFVPPGEVSELAVRFEGDELRTTIRGEKKHDLAFSIQEDL